MVNYEQHILKVSIIFLSNTLSSVTSKYLLIDLEKTIVDYPSNSLQCYSSLTKPDMKLICPAARSSYCVKELSTLKPGYNHFNCNYHIHYYDYCY
jgi:hypothetical protein